MTGLKPAVALLDTGSDYNLIDESLIPANISPIELVTTSGVNGTHTASNYNIALFLSEIDMSFQCGILSMPHRSDRLYPMILGRNFMQKFRFVYDGRVGIETIEWIENDNAV